MERESSQQPAPPRTARRRLGDGLAQAAGDLRRDAGLGGVVAQQFLRILEFQSRRKLAARDSADCPECCAAESLFSCFILTLFCFGEQGGEGLAGAEQLSAHGVGRLAGQRADLFIA